MSDVQPEPTEFTEFTDEDLATVRAGFATLDELCAQREETPEEVRRLVAEGRLPQPSYTLPDGTQLYPRDHLDLLDAAGSADLLRSHFDDRHRAATSALGLTDVEPAEDWDAYLSGEAGAGLREVTPEAMVERKALVTEIDTMAAAPAPQDESWRTRLREAVDDLDDLVRPATDHDRRRWGTTTRDSHVTAIRARFLADG